MATGRTHWFLGVWLAVTAFITLQRGVDVLWGIVILLSLAALVAALLPRLQLLGVRVRRLEFPRSAMVGEPQRVGYEIETSMPLPRYGIEIHEQLDGTEWSLAMYVARCRGTRQYFSLWTPRLRGCWRLKKLRLASGYPLGMRRASSTLLGESREIIVYPDFVHLRWLPVQGAARGTIDRSHAMQRGGHGEFFALKPYQHGDEARHVHWRATARLGELVTREHEHEEGQQLWIVLELAAAMHVGSGLAGTCEQMIRIAHSVIVKACAEGIPVGVLYRVADSIQSRAPAADRSSYEQLRDTLARVEAHAQLPLDIWLPRFREQLPNGGTWLIFNLAGESQRGQLQATAREQLATPLLVELDKASFANAVSDSASSQSGQSIGAQPTTLRSADGIVSIVARNDDLTGLFAP